MDPPAGVTAHEGLLSDPACSSSRFACRDPWEWSSSVDRFITPSSGTTPRTTYKPDKTAACHSVLAVSATRLVFSPTLGLWCPECSTFGGRRNSFTAAPSAAPLVGISPPNWLGISHTTGLLEGGGPAPQRGCFSAHPPAYSPLYVTRLPSQCQRLRHTPLTADPRSAVGALSVLLLPADRVGRESTAGHPSRPPPVRDSCPMSSWAFRRLRRGLGQLRAGPDPVS